VQVRLQPLRGRRADRQQVRQPLVEDDRRLHLERQAERVVDVVGRVVAGRHLLGAVGGGEAAAVVVDQQHRLERQPVEQHLSPGPPALAEQTDGEEARRQGGQADPVGGDAEPGDEDHQPDGEDGVRPATPTAPHRLVLLHPPETSLAG